MTDWFQFYDSPIKSEHGEGIIPYADMFQFYDSPIKRQSYYVRNVIE